jgi:hypothetical protein
MPLVAKLYMNGDAICSLITIAKLRRVSSRHRPKNRAWDHKN